MHMVAISPLEVIFAAMQVLSPASTRKFLPEHEAVLIAPDDSFLDGSSRYQSYFCSPPQFPNLCTFHPKRWSLASPR
jgi:hypothetical protein